MTEQIAFVLGTVGLPVANSRSGSKGLKNPTSEQFALFLRCSEG